jgi:thiol-disulfide isomerase/thioredoxin
MSEIINSEKELELFLNSCPKAAVLFYASWCPFSQRFLPIFEQKAESFKGSCRRVAIDDLGGLVGKYSINVYPTVILFENGKASKRLDGRSGVGLNEKQLSEFIGGCGLPQG